MSLTSSQARDQFPDLVSQAAYGKRRTIITRRGKKVAAIVPIEDLEVLQSLEDARDIKLIESAFKEGEFEDWKIAKKRLLKQRGLTETDLQGTDNVFTEDREEG
jgi:prevent-host-death family protein